MSAKSPLAPGAAMAALDLGVSRALALAGVAAAAQAGEAGVRLTGVGALPTRLTAAGYVQNYDETVAAARAALAQAERMAGQRIAAAMACYGGPGVSAARLRGEAQGGGPFDDRAARAAVSAACAKARKPGRRVLHVQPLGYQIDGGAYVHDPRGLKGQSLAADVCVVTIPEAAAAALEACAAEAGAPLSQIIAAPHAAGLAVLSADDRAAGAVAIEIGAAHTGIAAYVAGALVHAETLPHGAGSVTQAIAAQFGAPFQAAEHLKRTHSGFAPGPALIETARIGAGGRLEPVQITRGALGEATGQAWETLLQRAAARLKAAAPAAVALKWPVTLAGGGAETPGLERLAEAIFGAPVRIGRPLGFPELAAAAAGASLASPVGALAWPGLSQGEARPPRAAKAGPASRGPSAAMGRAWDWFRVHF